MRKVAFFDFSFEINIIANMVYQEKEGTLPPAIPAFATPHLVAAHRGRAAGGRAHLRFVAKVRAVLSTGVLKRSQRRKQQMIKFVNDVL